MSTSSKIASAIKKKDDDIQLIEEETDSRQ